MGDILELINGDRGKNYPSKDKLHLSGIPFVSAINLENNTVSEEKLLYLSDKQFDLLGSGKLKKNDVIFCLRGSLGKNAVYPFNEGAIASSLVILRLFNIELIDLSFFSFYINSPLITEEISKYNNGTAQPNLSAGNLSDFLFPLPPFNEQHRIVAKIEELLPYIDQYDKQEKALTALNQTFPEQLKKSILQAAIQGKLTEQLPTDEPVSELLKRIEAEKVRLISKGKLKKPKLRDNSQNAKFEPSFEIPKGWAWVRLDDITYSVGNKNNQIQTKEYKKNGRYPIVSQGNNLIDGYHNDDNKVIFDLPLIMFGDHTRNVKYIDFPFIIGADGTKFHKAIIINTKYIYFWMLISSFSLRNRGYARHYVLLKELTIPLPPLEEQHRIVEKIELLFSQIEKLKM